jgi:hypothetical protein
MSRVLVTKHLTPNPSEFRLAFRLHRLQEGSELLSSQVDDACRMAHHYPVALRNEQMIAQLIPVLVQRALQVARFEQMIHLALDQPVPSARLEHKIQFGIRKLHTVIKRNPALRQMPC